MPCVVILTALPVESFAVCAHLTELRWVNHPQGTTYQQGIFSNGESSWDVKVVQTGAGNVGVAFETERAISYFRPRVVLFIGVAGGVKDVSLGDVVASTKIYGYESGKADSKFSPRPEAVPASYNLIQLARAESRKTDWLRQLRLESKYTPHVFVAPMASGEKVIYSTTSETFRLLQENYNDAIAVEMEGWGFLKAAQANQQVSAIVIRGISDLLDGKSEVDQSGSQEIASCHASAFAFTMLAHLELGITEIYNSPIPEDNNVLPSIESRLLEILLQIPALNSQENRTVLLRDLPRNPVSTINRTNASMIDLNNIIYAVSAWGRLTSGKLALAILIENALCFSEETQLEPYLRTLLLEIT
jgi:nucleoside phosphorylase